MGYFEQNSVIISHCARWKKNTFSFQNSGTFEPIIRCEWALLMKCWLLRTFSSWTNLEFKRWQMSCWGCLKGTCKWIPRHSPPKNDTQFSVPDVSRVQVILFDKSCWVEKLKTFSLKKLILHRVSLKNVTTFLNLNLESLLVKTKILNFSNVIFSNVIFSEELRYITILNIYFLNSLKIFRRLWKLKIKSKSEFSLTSSIDSLFDLIFNFHNLLNIFKLF